MRIRPDIVISALLGGLALGWALQLYNQKASMEAIEGPAARVDHESAPPATVQRDAEPKPAPPAPPGPAASQTVAFVDVNFRERFSDRAREFFARAAGLPAQQRQSQAQEIERDLLLLEMAGGLSAGEIFLVRTGLIRETVSDPVEQTAQIKALQERYQNDTAVAPPIPARVLK